MVHYIHISGRKEQKKDATLRVLHRKPGKIRFNTIVSESTGFCILRGFSTPSIRSTALHSKGFYSLLKKESLQMSTRPIKLPIIHSLMPIRDHHIFQVHLRIALENNQTCLWMCHRWHLKILSLFRYKLTSKSPMFRSHCKTTRHKRNLWWFFACLASLCISTCSS